MTEPELPDLEALWAADHGLPAAGAEREAMWQVSTDPVRMLDMLEPAFADDKISDRKIRLYVCACCRRVWHQLSAETRRNHVE
ncbi:MAG: hypothetical protein JNM56_29750, partial [Planctomycetia bacterium]|nr:hypothetical protein [Planctomycetia bacterium]